MCLGPLFSFLRNALIHRIAHRVSFARCSVHIVSLLFWLWLHENTFLWWCCLRHSLGVSVPICSICLSLLSPSTVAVFLCHFALLVRKNGFDNCSVTVLFWSFLGGSIFCDANFLGRLRSCLRCRCRCCSCLLSFLVCPSVHLVVASSCLKQSASETFSKTSASCEHERCVCFPLFLSPFWCRVCCPLVVRFSVSRHLHIRPSALLWHKSWNGSYMVGMR